MVCVNVGCCSCVFFFVCAALLSLVACGAGGVRCLSFVVGCVVGVLLVVRCCCAVCILARCCWLLVVADCGLLLCVVCRVTSLFVDVR